MVEERIARDGNHHGGAVGLAEQLEEQRIGLARAGGEDNALGVDLDAATSVVARDRATRVEQSEGLRVVPQCFW